MRTALGALAGIAAMLAACQNEPPAAEPRNVSARRPPQPACDQARVQLDRRQRGGSLLFEESGEAMTDRQSWMRLEQSGRDRIVEDLAIVAACSAEAPRREVEVTIRDEGGRVLRSERVAPSTDFRAP